MYTTASVNRMTENTRTVTRITCYAISARLPLVCGKPAFHAQLSVQVLWGVWLSRRCLRRCPDRVFSFVDGRCRPGPGKCRLFALVGT
jgi:hypothetical protein